MAVKKNIIYIVTFKGFNYKSENLFVTKKDAYNFLAWNKEAIKEGCQSCNVSKLNTKKQSIIEFCHYQFNGKRFIKHSRFNDSKMIKRATESLK